MAKEKRAKSGKPHKDRHDHAMPATKLLREDHRRIENFFDDLEETDDVLKKSEIRDRLLAEVRVHKAVVEELIYPAIGDVLGETLVEEAREELEELEPLLETVEMTAPDDSAFESHWQKLARQLAHHIQWEEQELFNPADENEELDLARLSPRVAELRREVMAEQPVTTWEQNTDPELSDVD